MCAGFSPLIEMTGACPAREGSVVVGVSGVGFARPAAADWLNRAASWALVTQTGLRSLGPSMTQSSFALTCWRLPVVAWMTVA